MLFDPRADDVRVHTDSACGAEFEEREHEVVVACVELEAELDDRTRLLDGFACFTARTVGSSASSAIAAVSRLRATRPGCCTR